jgi:hypothetical protein
MSQIRILKSALKHGITELQIRQVLSDRYTTKQYPIHDDSHGNPQEMLVGYTQSNVLLEIAVRYGSDFNDIFHSNKVSAKYKKLYEGS